jgi:hypothetical protein
VHNVGYKYLLVLNIRTVASQQGGLFENNGRNAVVAIQQGDLFENNGRNAVVAVEQGDLLGNNGRNAVITGRLAGLFLGPLEHDVT